MLYLRSLTSSVILKASLKLPPNQHNHIWNAHLQHTLFSRTLQQASHYNQLNINVHISQSPWRRGNQVNNKHSKSERFKYGQLLCRGIKRKKLFFVCVMQSHKTWQNLNYKSLLRLIFPLYSNTVVTLGGSLCLRSMCQSYVSCLHLQRKSTNKRSKSPSLDLL